MTSSNTQDKEQHDRVSNDNQDTDWVIVKAEESPAKEDFDVIDKAEARCWCGGSDPERCRQRGHTFPLCKVDQEELWPKQPDEIHDRPHESENERGDTSSGANKSTNEQSSASPLNEATNEQSNASPLNEATKKSAPGSVSHPPTSNNSGGPFTKLAVLTDLLLDPTRTNR